MDEIKKELAELKELVSKLLEIEIKKFELQYGWLNRPLKGSTRQKQD